MSQANRTEVAPRQRLYRSRDAARVLGVSESMLRVLERRALLTALSLKQFGNRMKRYDADEVDALAERMIAEAKVTSAAAAS
jgi:hypothetical protein